MPVTVDLLTGAAAGCFSFRVDSGGEDALGDDGDEAEGGLADPFAVDTSLAATLPTWAVGLGAERLPDQTLGNCRGAIGRRFLCFLGEDSAL